MPDEVLTPTEDHRPVAGFFGKLPTTGDFVWRGLPDAFRKHWDFWLTRHVAPLQHHGRPFPPEGLRFRLISGSRLAAGLILPSHDSADRRFPLSLLVIADRDLTLPAVDDWCDAALALHPETLAPDDLWRALDTLPAPASDTLSTGPMLLWAKGAAPQTTDPADPGPAIQALMPA